ncbi:MAG: HAD family phosphatase [Chloroflexota bacterium]|nr:MAG: hypothetical protein DIU68_16740 [Chloroflexota bacterium]
MIDHIQAVIFDMDGLLVDSEPVWMICERELLARRGKEWDFEIQRRLIGMRTHDFLHGMIAGYDLKDTYEDLRAELLDSMCALVPQKVVVRPGAPEVIALLQEHNLPCAIASSSARVIIEAVVESQGWQDIFHVRVSGDDVEHGKPAPDVYLEAARRLSVAPEHCLALEDSPTGARAAVAAGMTTIAIPDPWHAHPELFDGITPYVYESLHDVARLLEARVTP